MAKNGPEYVEDDLFGQKWSHKRCLYWSELTPCQISKKSEKIFRGVAAKACLGTFWAQKQTLTDFY